MVNMAKVQGCTTLHIVPDTYKAGTSKSIEHECRAGGIQPIRVVIDNMNQNLPKSANDMKSFMASGENKNAFVQILFDVAIKHFILLSKL